MASPVEIIADALDDSGLVGCDCCASDEQGYYAADDCLVEDGYKDHTYGGNCRHAERRTTVLARIAVAALEQHA